MDGWTPLCLAADVPQQRGRIVESSVGPLAVFVANGAAFVLENVCPHRGGDLGEGYVMNGCVYCPLHAWPFELASGTSPTHFGARVKTFPARLENGWVEAQLAAQKPLEGVS